MVVFVQPTLSWHFLGGVSLLFLSVFKDKPGSNCCDNLALRSILLNVNRAICLLFPNRRLVIAIHNVEFYIDVSVKPGRTTVRGSNTDAETSFLFVYTKWGLLAFTIKPTKKGGNRMDNLLRWYQIFCYLVYSNNWITMMKGECTYVQGLFEEDPSRFGLDVKVLEV